MEEYKLKNIQTDAIDKLNIIKIDNDVNPLLVLFDKNIIKTKYDCVSQTHINDVTKHIIYDITGDENIMRIPIPHEGEMIRLCDITIENKINKIQLIINKSIIHEDTSLFKKYIPLKIGHNYSLLIYFDKTEDIFINKVQLSYEYIYLNIVVPNLRLNNDKSNYLLNRITDTDVCIKQFIINISNETYTPFPLPSVCINYDIIYDIEVLDIDGDINIILNQPKIESFIYLNGESHVSDEFNVLNPLSLMSLSNCDIRIRTTSKEQLIMVKYKCKNIILDDSPIIINNNYFDSNYNKMA